MSQYSLTTYRTNGTVMMDGFTKGGVLIDVVRCPAGQNGSAGYSRARSTALTYSFAQQGGHKITIGPDRLGSNGIEGVVSWAYDINAPQQDTYLYVFASAVTNPNQYSASYTNDAGDLLVDPSYPVPQFLGAVQFAPQASVSYSTQDGYTANRHTVSVNMRSSADQIIVAALPDSSNSGDWYALDRESIRAGEGAVTILLTVYSKQTSYLLPSLHFYALNRIRDSGSQYAIKLYDGAGNLTFDSASESMNTKAQLDVTISESATNSYAMPATITPGTGIPYYYRSDYFRSQNRTSSRARRYVGVTRRTGQTLQTGVVFDSDVDARSLSVNYQYKAGSTLLRYVPVIEVSQQSASNIAGSQAASLSSFPGFLGSNINYYTAKPGETVSLGAPSYGTPRPTYQWYRNGVPISGATSESYSFVCKQSDDGAVFDIGATNNLGTAWGDTTTFYIDTSVAPRITDSYVRNAQGQAQDSFNVGDTVTIGFSASGSPTPTCYIYLNSSGGAGGPGKKADSLGSAQFTFTAFRPDGANGQAPIRFQIECSNDGEHSTHGVSQTFYVNVN